ncbi:MAG TPA: ATP-binding protein [Gemmatimonadaceae bacterium]
MNRPRRPLERRLFGVAAAGWGWQGWSAIAFVVVHALWLLLDPTPASAREAIGNAFFIPVGVLMAAMAWMNTRDQRLHPRARRGWRRLAAAYVVLGISTNLWAVNDLFLGHVRVTRAVVDLFSLAYIVILTGGLLSFSPGQRTRSARVRVSLEFAMIGIATTMVVWQFMIRPRVLAAAQLDWTVVPSLLSPAGELIGVLAIAHVLMRGTDRASAIALSFVGAGQVLNLIGDSIYTPLAVAGTYSGGHPVDLLWMLGDGAMFIGAAYQFHNGATEARVRASTDPGGFIRLPYLFVLGGFLPILSASSHWSRGDRMILYATVLLTLMIVARQVVALRENARLDEDRRLQEARFRSLVQHSSDTVTIVDENGTVRYQSASCERLLGYPPQHLVGEPLLGIVHPADMASVDAMLVEAVHSAEHTRPVRWRACNQTGDWVQLETIATNLLHDPAIHGVVLTSRDVSERVALESQLLQAQKMEAVGRLAGGIAHDFNNLLTAIRMTAAIVAEDLPASSGLAEEMREIERSVDRGSSLTRQLLAFSKKELIQPTLIDLAEVVAGIEPMIRRLVAKDVTLDIRATLQPWRVLADRGQLEQIVMNLALNARDAMPEHGTLTIAVGVTSVDLVTARATPGLLQRDYVTLTVSDTGYGMTSEVQSHLFEPFFTTKAVGKGTGLGLSTVYAIVQQCGGAISVRSAPGEGASFTIYLPRAGSESRAPAPAAGVAGPTGGRERILVVDDEESVRSAVRRILQRYGYEVLDAADGAEGLEILRREGDRVALLLTDMVMPVMSGRELVEHAAQRFPELRIVVMSGHTEDPSLRQGQLANEHAFIAKPFTVTDLSATIRRVLDGSAGTRLDATPAGATTG